MEVRVVSLYLLHYLYSYLPIHQNPFLCLFVDIYNLASLDDNLKSERFVTSLILNGKGEEVICHTEIGTFRTISTSTILTNGCVNNLLFYFFSHVYI